MSNGDENDLRVFKALLEQQRERLVALANTAGSAAAVVELDQSRVGRLSRMDALQSQAMSQETLRRRGLELQRIDTALRRMAAGEYGYCLRCDEAIAPARLRIDPAVSLCIACASEDE